jgi:predicted dehydrogenase
VRFALIGSSGHYNYYEPVLEEVPGFQVAAVALSQAGESMEKFASAPGVTAQTPRYTDYRQMLDKVRPDLVQLCVQTNGIPGFIEECLRRGIAVMSEKPLAKDLDTLAQLYQVARETRVPLAPLHGYRRMDCFVAAQAAVRAGQIGEPIASTNQISYKWGKSRGDSFKRRETFPGIVPFIGIHAIDWLVWLLGDVFVEVKGWESTTAHPDFPACATQASFMLRMQNGGVASVALDFLRPEAAPTHGDERLRVAGSRGVIESHAIDGSVTLINDAGVQALDVLHVQSWYTTFVKAVQGQGPSFITLEQAFRVTEIAIKTQQAIDTGQTVSLARSPYTSAQG